MLACCDGWTQWFPGEINRVYPGEDSYDINFEDGERKKKVPSVQIRGAATRGDVATRKPGERVKAKCDGWTKYFDGEITRANDDGTYDITFDDGERKLGVVDSQIQDLGLPPAVPPPAESTEQSSFESSMVGL